MLHLALDGYCPQVARLNDLNLVYNLLSILPPKLGLHAIAPPYVYHRQGYHGDDGVDGFIFVAESHISISTYVSTGLVAADVFSCKKFSTTEIVQELTVAFSLTDVKTAILERSSS